MTYKLFPFLKINSFLSPFGAILYGKKRVPKIRCHATALAILKSLNTKVALADPPTNTDSGSDFPEDRSARTQITNRGVNSLEEPIPQFQLPLNLELTDRSWTGTASYYSRAGCVGCDPNMIMANGEPLQDNQLTLAFMRVPLNSLVLVENIENDQSEENIKNNRYRIAKVTDRGGFEKHGFIADLSLGLRNAIDGGHLTQVKITLLQLIEDDYSK